MEKSVVKSRLIPISVAILRGIIGLTFILSGFLKAIDPWGTIYKFTEYINVLGFTELVPLTSFLSISVAAFEFILGIFILFGCYRRGGVILLLLSFVIFLPLTLYLAVTDNVKDCGCFGDAIHISNWATFIKNVFLTGGLFFLLKYNKQLKNIYGFAVQWIVGVLSFIFIITISFIGYIYQPLIDFRPFKVGTPILNEEKISVENNFLFIYEKGGEKKEFKIDSLPGEDWTFVDRVEVNSPKIDNADYLSISENGMDITADVISKEGEGIILLFPALKDVEVSYTYAINEIYDMAQKNGISFVGLTSSSQDEINEWIDLSMASYKMYIVDDSVLKEIARGNPAIVFIKDGVIHWKRALQSIPIETLQSSEDLNSIETDVDNMQLLWGLFILYAGSMILLLIINRTHKVINFTTSRSKKNQNKNVPLQSE